MMSYNVDSITKNNIDKRILDITELRLLLHTYFYNTQYIGDLVSLIMNTNIASNIYNYDANSRSITIKIKKTVLKKMNNYTHTPDFYYGIFNNVFKIFLMNNSSALCNIAKNHGYEHCITNEFIDNCVLGLYTITCLSDNIIVLYL